MIDWLTCRIPVWLPEPIAGGWTIVLNRDGSEKCRTPHRLMVNGSFESTLSVRAPSRTELEISGNVTKWLQGHNLYGPEDLLGLLWTALQRLEPHLGGSLAEIGLTGPDALLDTIITRIDLTAMLTLDTPGDVLSWIRSAYATGAARRRGRGIMREGTLVYGDASGRSFTRWQLVIYSKGQEITAHPLPTMMMQDPEVLEWTNRCLRVEARLGRLELTERGLRRLGAWEPGTPAMMWSEKVGSLSFNDATVGQDDDLAKLPDHLRGTFAQWKLGLDLRELCSKPKFYRHRAAIMELIGVDVAIPPASAATASVVPIKRVLEARPAGRPAWADRIDEQLCAGGAFAFRTAA
jgi:hypothetical protein